MSVQGEIRSRGSARAVAEGPTLLRSIQALVQVIRVTFLVDGVYRQKSAGS